MTLIEKAILKQLSIGIPDKFLKTFHNRHSNALDAQIPVIFSSLMRSYGIVSPEDLEETNKNSEKKYLISVNLRSQCIKKLKTLKRLQKQLGWIILMPKSYC